MSNTDENENTQETQHRDHPRMNEHRRRGAHVTHDEGDSITHDDKQGGHGGHSGGHSEGMHAGHERLFKRRFFVSLVLSIPVLLYSEGFQALVGFSVPAFSGSEWVSPLFAVFIFAYGGVPFIEMAIPELRTRSPGMMTLITLAISVAFVYSLATLVFLPGMDFFWELATLIDIMLLGHWIEMRSVRQASGALSELAKLMPDTAERITENGVEEVPAADLREGDLVLVRPGASVPADGVVERGDSTVSEAMITGESMPISKRSGDEVIGGTVNGEGSLRIRNAPALARADVGIAIGSGTDVAVESADVVLVQNNPVDVVRLITLSRKSYRKMQQNLVWAAGYNVFAIPLAAGILAPIGILLSPAVGAVLMSLSTIIVAINAQFLRRTDLSLPNPSESRPVAPPAGTHELTNKSH